MEILNCWISPEGRFYDCYFGDHETKAEEIVKNIGIEVKWSDYCTTTLENLGWLHVSDKSLWIKETRNNLQLCTQAQINTLYDKAKGTFYENFIMELINKASDLALA